MNKLVIRRSIVGWLLWAILSLVIIASELIRTNYHVNGIVLAFSLTLIASAVQLLFTRPRVIIDDEGISAVVFGGRKFLWKEVKRAELKYMHRSGDKITLILQDNSHHSFTLFGVNVSSDEVYFEIMQRIRKYGRHADSQAEGIIEDEGDELL